MIARWFPSVTLVVMLLVAAAIWVPPAQGDGPFRGNATATPAQPRADLTALAAATAQRPPFDSSRRPPAQTAQAAQPIAQAPRVSLAGILTDASEPMALLRISTDGRLRRASQGDAVADWRIVRIDTASVIIRDPSGDESVLRLGK